MKEPGVNVLHEMCQSLQFSVAAHEPCTLGCVNVYWNGTKCTGNALSIRATAWSQQIGEKQSFHMSLFLYLFGLFNLSYECICDRFDYRQCCNSHAGIFKL